MRQAVMTAPGKIEFRQVARPAAAAGEVLVRIQRIGVCGSDIHVYHGLHPYTSYPVVQGHEVSGVVAEVGAGVTGFAVGDPVVFMPQVTCGSCYPCRHGMYHICDHLKVMGFQTDGAGQDYFPVAAAMTLKLPSSLNPNQGAMIEPLAVACHAVRRAGGVQGEKVVVLGAGTIGNLVGQVARATGAADVLITDVSEYKLAKARQVGFAHTFNPLQGNFAQAVLDAFGPDKADVMFECVGVQDTITDAVAAARKGSRIVIVGVFGKKPVVDLGLVQDRELTLTGTLMYQKADYEQAIALAAAGKVRLEDLISDHFPFEQYLQAYEKIERAKGNIMKVMIDLE